MLYEFGNFLVTSIITLSPWSTCNHQTILHSEVTTIVRPLGDNWSPVTGRWAIGRFQLDSSEWCMRIVRLLKTPKLRAWSLMEMLPSSRSHCEVRKSTKFLRVWRSTLFPRSSKKEHALRWKYDGKIDFRLNPMTSSIANTLKCMHWNVCQNGYEMGAKIFNSRPSLKIPFHFFDTSFVQCSPQWLWVKILPWWMERSVLQSL